MGFSSGQNQSKKRGSLSEINVTPLVDVMLVLLIVFMVSAPMMQQGIDVNLPKTEGKAISENKEPIVLSINKERQIFIDDQPVAQKDVVAKLSAMAQNRPDLQVHVRADQGLNYGLVAQMIGEIRKSGIEKVGLVTLPSDKLSQ